MAPCPDDFFLQYRWREGSVPPPGHYRLGVEVGADGTGVATLDLGYASDGPSVEVPLGLDARDRDALCVALTEAGLWTEDWRGPDRPVVGGSSWDLTATAGGRTVTVPRHATAASGATAAPLEAAVRAAVPEAVWASFRARQRAFVESHR